MAKKYQIIGGFPSDGYFPIVTVNALDNGTEVTITDINGEHVFIVLNGKDGKDGEIDTDAINKMISSAEMTAEDINILFKNT